MSLEPSDFRNQTEAELLGYMTMQRDDPDAARAAWEELYRRHHKYLIYVLGRSHGRQLGGQDGVEGLMIEAFRSIFEWAGRQPDPESVIAKFSKPTADRTRRAVLGYLTTIAKNLLKDRFRSQKSDVALNRFEILQLSESQWDREWERRSTQESATVSREALATYERVLGLLSEREQDVLRLSLPWYDPAKGEFNLPPGEANRVAQSIGTTPENFRQIRRRALKRIRDHFQQKERTLSAIGDK